MKTGDLVRHKDGHEKRLGVVKEVSFLWKDASLYSVTLFVVWNDYKYEDWDYYAFLAYHEVA
jgi:hypothetical protein